VESVSASLLLRKSGSAEKKAIDKMNVLFLFIFRRIVRWPVSDAKRIFSCLFTISILSVTIWDVSVLEQWQAAYRNS
jgi:hypothetical protein